jgi:hypothetical protein
MKSLPAIIAATVAAATVAAVISLPAGADESKKDSSSEPAPPELVACLHDHGLDAPTEISDFKGWVIQQLQTDAGKAAVSACGLNTEPDEKVGDGPPKDEDHAGTGPCADAKRAAVSRARTRQAAKAARRSAPAGT